eukprot:187173-Pyramimonas_sp.AAC.1
MTASIACAVVAHTHEHTRAHTHTQLTLGCTCRDAVGCSRCIVCGAAGEAEFAGQLRPPLGTCGFGRLDCVNS